ncbi:MAG: D-aminoacylase [Anaerolineaceae bacterium]|nr:D-aminoacylase [Anaerolineaceae bacterium]
MLDIIIKNAEIIDGSGKPRFKADVAVLNGKIVNIAANLEHETKLTIDAQGLILSPGFIDPHTHSDISLFRFPKAESRIYQGVTTEVTGNCGYAPAPIYGAAVKEVKTDAQLFGVDITWNSMAEYLEALGQNGHAVNIVPLIGHNTIRGSVLGYGDVKPDEKQMKAMESLITAAMEEGARGMSSGIYYPPGCYAENEEIIRLAKVVAKFDGIYATHVRSETDKVIESAIEAFQVGLQAGIKVQYSHIKIEGYRNWHLIDDFMKLLDGDLAGDISLLCDKYPYLASSTNLFTMMPYWAQADGGATIAARVMDSSTRNKLREDWKSNQIEWDNRSGVRDWEDILITGCHSHPEYEGQNVMEIAANLSQDPLETTLDLIGLDDAAVSAVFFTQNKENHLRLIQHPLVAAGSDGASLANVEGKSHPRSFGTFARYIRRYVREEELFSLEECVHRMTCMPAAHFNLTGRGVITENAWADLVLFDAEKITDTATFTDPHQYAKGVEYVLVNGEVVLEKGEHNGKLAGRIL